MIGLDGYFKVTGVEYSGSEDSGSGHLFWYTRRRESSGEFGKMFKDACDAIDQNVGEEKIKKVLTS